MIWSARSASLLVVVALAASGCTRETAGPETHAASAAQLESQTASAPHANAGGADAPARESEAPAREPEAPARAADTSDPLSSRALADAAPLPAATPAFRDVQIPAGTVLAIALRTAVASDTSRVEDRVSGTLRRPVVVDGVEVLPAGTVVTGTVTEAQRSGRVKGRARVAFRFSMLDLPGDGPQRPIRTAVIAREAEGTKKQDAAKIGGGAAAGAVIGGILGGGDGAAKGAAIGGGAGTGVVLATRGREVQLPAGTNVSARLLDPVVVRVR